MIRCLLTLILLFLATASHAADLPSALQSGAVDANTDLSMSYLAMIFGHVGNVLHGSSGQMLGQMMGTFNKGVMAIAAVILGYNSIFTVARFATEGTLMSPNKNTYMILLRVAIGFSLLIPSSETGYNLLQTTMMSVIKYSVKFADNVWSGALDRLSNGATIWHLPAFQDDSYGYGKTGNDNGIMASSFVTANLASNPIAPNELKTLCPQLDSVQRAKMCSMPTSISDLHKDRNSIPDEKSFAEALFFNMVCLSSHNIKQNEFEMPTLDDSNENITYPYNCGSFNVKSAANTLYAGSAEPAQVQKVGSDVLAQAVAYTQVANTYVCQHLQAKYKDKNYSQCAANAASNPVSGISDEQINVAQTMMATFLAAGEWANQAVSRSVSAANKGRRNFIPRAQASGWVMAGSYYWALANLQGAYSEGSNLTNYAFNADTATNIKSIVLINRNNLKRNTANLSGLSFILLRQNAATSSKGSTGGTETQGKWGSWKLGIGSFLLSLFGPLIDVIKTLALIMGMFSTQGGVFGMGSDPILWLYRMGQQCLNLSAAMFFTGLLTNIAVLLPFIICRPMVDLFAPTTQAYAWLKVIIISSSVLFLTVGLMLTFALPMYPFFVFSFGVVGWFVMVVESMVAMPLVALGITHPEGHDILGKAEQALMLMLGVFLRPALMVIGLIASMILSYVVLRFLIWTYSSFLLDLFNPLPNTAKELDGSIYAGAMRATGNMILSTDSLYGGILKALITLPILLFIFAAIAYQAVISCYSLIFALPDYILRWIGGPQQTSAVNPAEMAQGMTSRISGLGGQFGQQVSNLGKNFLKQKSGTDIKGTTDPGGKKKSLKEKLMSKKISW